MWRMLQSQRPPTAKFPCLRRSPFWVVAVLVLVLQWLQVLQQSVLLAAVLVVEAATQQLFQLCQRLMILRQQPTLADPAMTLKWL